jgi:hypothetical protein
MRWYPKVALAGILAVSLSPVVSAQSNICEEPLGPVPNENQARMQFLELQARERARLAMERVNWTASIVPVKYATSANSLKPLCIFGIEVVPQPAMKLVALRAPKELMPAIEEALKRLDVPAPIAKGIELTAYVVVAADSPEQGTQPLPATLQAVANQLKGILPAGNLYLADTVVARGIDGQGLRVNGVTDLMVTATIREGADPVIHLERLNVSTNNATFNTSLDVPVGAQVVVGKATAQPFGNTPKRAVVLVITARVLN